MAHLSAKKFKFPKKETTDRSLLMNLIVSFLQRVVRDSNINSSGLDEILCKKSFVCSHCGQGGEVRLDGESLCCWECFRRDTCCPTAVAEGACTTCNITELALHQSSNKMLCIDCWTQDQWEELELQESDPAVSNSQ